METLSSTITAGFDTATVISDLETFISTLADTDYWNNENESVSRLRHLMAKADILHEGCGGITIWLNSRLMEKDMLQLSLEMFCERLAALSAE